MALDGVVIYNIKNELASKLIGSRVDKIYQSEKDEIVISIRGFGENYKLLLTANAQSPRMCITTEQRQNPSQPPMFCMMLRKHLQGGKILSISQPNFERILKVEIQSLNDFGDMTTKFLIIEIMGKHSNIILVDENDKILDCIKRVNFEKSSVREVLPGKQYVLPPNTKENPLNVTKGDFIKIIEKSTLTSMQKIIYQNYTGVSPSLASEILFSSGLEDNIAHYKENPELNEKVYLAFSKFFDNIDNDVTPLIFYENEKPKDFYAYDLALYSMYEKEKINSISEMLEAFYNKKDIINKVSQKTADIRKLLQNNLERNVKKLDLHKNILKDSEKKEKNKLYGELIIANLYQIQKGDKILEAVNYYSEENENISIKLNENKSPQENAQNYYKKYNKQKRSEEMAVTQIAEIEKEIEYIESVLTSLTTVQTEEDVLDIREELAIYGFVKKSSSKNKKQKKSKPLKYVSSDGFEIYVGKNNMQNDYLTMKFADKKDIWCHTKNIPGSHVIIRCDGKDVSDKAIEDACYLAAHFSKAKDHSGVEVDYTEVKNVKKPNGSKAGMVIYLTNKTAFIKPDEKYIIENLKKID
ncbi:MAG: NFACT family protein [Lachnospirales bacterium]